MPQKNLSFQYHNLNFRYSPCATSDGGILADYLQKSPGNTKDKILKAVEMCWLSVALLDAKDPSATEEYVNTLKALASHIRLLTDLHRFDKQRVWDIIQAELSDFNDTETIHEKLDKLLELCENGISTKNSSKEEENYEEQLENNTSEALDFFS